MKILIWRTKYNNFNNTKDIMRAILKLKNIDKEHVKEFITGQVPIHSPLLLNNMEEACEEIVKYKNICICSDYDADGVCANYIMYMGLQSLSNKFNWDISYIIPERQDGYGLSNKNIDKAKEKNVDCIITVDNGISAYDAVEYAKSLGINVIITDHHKLTTQMPNCLVVDPQVDEYPFKYICGALIAFKFICALYELNKVEMPRELYDELLSFAAIATIADIMKLTDENRFFVYEGLKRINKTQNIGLRTLINEANITSIKADTIAFLIGPMINAAGRLASPTIAHDLFISEDIAECEKLAKKLIELNKQRKSLQKDIIDQIPADVLKDDFIVFYNPNAGKGVLGTIASSISDRYKKPCFVLSGHKRLTGSGRTAHGYSILSFINSSRDILDGGGHTEAAGITLLEENLDELRRRCNIHFKNWLQQNDKSLDDILYSLGEIPFSLIDLRFAENLEMLEPYGCGNPKITFISRNVNIREANIIGSTQNAIKFKFEQNGIHLDGIGFNNIINLYNDKMHNVDIAYTININEWNGIKTVQLQLVDIRRNEEFDDITIMREL